MQCKNHPDAEAAGRCTGCAEPFCGNCLVEVAGQQYCGGCKVMAVQDRPMVAQATMPCKEAGQAVMFAIIGAVAMVCVIPGLVMGALALSKASKAKQMMAADPRLTGSGKVRAGMLLGVADIVLSILLIIVSAARQQ